ncbi:MAG: hypothetical protein G3M78_08775 [Candidatus Nitrohelix vancouverensis]|uniref:Uncharacterized protein n=1 Tax=Candidatus Nitrohelix vancouverensis TaxID=2705534 RepID=A0A7T0G3L3_9BACT|nr:MAG: hypothetical protein G3M78_08775 [Candidatus Nitrohelix vancouverensis]
MSEAIKLHLNPEISRLLRQRFKDDEAALQAYVEGLIEESISKSAAPAEAPDKAKDSLEDYLNSGPSGSRSYGVKGQGW